MRQPCGRPSDLEQRPRGPLRGQVLTASTAAATARRSAHLRDKGDGGPVAESTSLAFWSEASDDREHDECVARSLLMRGFVRQPDPPAIDLHPVRCDVDLLEDVALGQHLHGSAKTVHLYHQDLA